MFSQYLQFSYRPYCAAIKPRLKGSSPPSDSAGDFSCASLSFNLSFHQPGYALVLLGYCLR